MPHSWTDPPAIAAGDTVGLAAHLNTFGTDIWYDRERVDWPYTNTSGSDVLAGQLMVLDPGADAAVTLPAGTTGEAGPFYIPLAPIADGASGFCARSGVVQLAYISVDPAPGDRLQASNIAGFCWIGTSNSFATALYASTTGYVYALLDAPPGILGAQQWVRGANVASATTITPAPGATVIPITGTTPIATINGGYRNRVLALEFAASGCTVTTAGNVALSGTYTSVAGTSLLLVHDGSAWHPVGADTGGGGGGGGVFSTSTDGLVPGPSGSEDDAAHVLAGDGSWLDTSTLGGGGGGSGSLLWDPYGLAVPAVAADLSVHDQWSLSGTLTTLTQEGDAVLFTNPGAAAVVERGAFGTTAGPYAVPTTGAFTVTACFIPNIYPVNYWSCLLSLRQSGNDKRIAARLVCDSSIFKIDGVNFTDYQTVSGASFGSTNWPVGFPIWLRIRDDATNCFWEVSRDGSHFSAFASGGTRSFCTPDQAGITMDSFGGTAGVSSMTVLSLSVVNTA